MRNDNFVFAFLLGAAILLASVAHAQDAIAPVAHHIDWTAHLDRWLSMAGEVLIPAFAGIALYLFQKRTGIDIEKISRDALHMALNTGVENSLLKRGLSIVQLDAATALLVAGEAVAYAKLSVPEKISLLKAPDALMTEIALAKIGEKRAAAGAPPIDMPRPAAVLLPSVAGAS